MMLVMAAKAQDGEWEQASADATKMRRKSSRLSMVQMSPPMEEENEEEEDVVEIHD